MSKFKNTGMYESTWVEVYKAIDHRGLKAEITIPVEAFPLLGEIFDGLKDSAIKNEEPIRALNDEWSDDRLSRIISVYPKSDVEIDKFMNQIETKVEKLVLNWVKRKLRMH